MSSTDMNHRLSVTLSEFVAESADKRVEIFAGQIFDLALQKLRDRRFPQGIAQTLYNPSMGKELLFENISIGVCR